MSSVGTLLREARLKAKLTQAQVGEAVETDSNNYSRYERDEVLPPRRRREKLAKLLNIDPDKLERAAGASPAPKRAPEEVADRYPSRAVLLKAAREAGTYSDLVLTAVAEMRLHAPADPGLSFWAAQLDFFQKFEADPSIAPEVEPEPDAEIGRITKWRQKRAREAAEAAEKAKIKG